jgi:hypothetical protein
MGISNTYINYVIFLFIGGFFMALALENGFAQATRFKNIVSSRW